HHDIPQEQGHDRRQVKACVTRRRRPVRDGVRLVVLVCGDRLGRRDGRRDDAGGLWRWLLLLDRRWWALAHVVGHWQSHPAIASQVEFDVGVDVFAEDITVGLDGAVESYA